jgi:DNA-directed RNA polymerase specialized sigma24 family protein
VQDAHDAEDRRLLDARDHGRLLANYFYPVRERCLVRLRNEDAADEAAQMVFDRLLSELESGKTYPVPVRVVVWKVTNWTLQGFYPGVKQDAPLPEDWDPAAHGDPFGDWERDHDLRALIDLLPRRQREVLTLFYVYGRSHDQIAEALDMTRNAVDQALSNGHRNLRKLLVA